MEHPDRKEVFNGPPSAADPYSRLTLHVPGVRVIPGRTLLFLDELQECPEARAALKYLAQDGRCDVIGSGPLLGTRCRQLEDAPSPPAGHERRVTMRPLDFEEFLWALGHGDDALDAPWGHCERLGPVPQAIRAAMMRRTRECLAVGGMPAVASAFAGAGDYGAAHDAQLMLHALYLGERRPRDRVPWVAGRACASPLPTDRTQFPPADMPRSASRLH